MSGQFKRAPLVYVTARVRTTELPQLLTEQYAALHQAMIKNKLPEPGQSEVHGFEFGLDGSGVQMKFLRRAFFSADRRESLVIDGDVIEYRVSAYTKYKDFMARFKRLVNALTEAVDVLGQVSCQEYTLSYADVIVPYGGRSLADYFADSGKILPLDSFFHNPNLDAAGKSEIRVGQVQISRIVAPSEKIDLVLEQLPVRDGKMARALPMAMVEPDAKFNMPLNINQPDDLSAVTDYALLLTQAAKLENRELGELDMEQQFLSLHKLTKETFWKLINTPVCQQDWEYVTK